MAKRKRTRKTAAKSKAKTEPAAPAAVAPDVTPSEPEARDKPYLWVTWVNALLADDDQCQYQAWFRAHYKYARDEKDLDQWLKDHGRAVEKRAAELVDQGWAISVESQNQMTIRGKVTVSGKPDIVGRRPGEVLISDEKTGRQRAKDRWQVRTYIALYPFVQPVNGRKVYGEVVYNDDIKLIQLTTDSKARIFDQINISGGPAVPVKVPSAKECSRCDIPNCDERDETALEGSSMGIF